MIAHIVLFAPKPGLKESEQQSFAQSFQEACRGIPAIRRARIGSILELNAAPALVVGDSPYSAAAVMEFDDYIGLQAYLKHPLHEVLGKLFWQYCGATLVIDAEMGDPKTEDVGSLFGLKTE